MASDVHISTFIQDAHQIYSKVHNTFCFRILTYLCEMVKSIQNIQIMYYVHLKSFGNYDTV